jgi:hypothetical protein
MLVYKPYFKARRYKPEFPNEKTSPDLGLVCIVIFVALLIVCCFLN